MRIRPVDGQLIRFPDPPYAFLPEKGANVRDCPYWRRRLVRGVVVLIDEQPNTTTDAEPAEAPQED